MRSWRLTNAEWKKLAPLLEGAASPKTGQGRPRGRPRSTDLRALAQACLFRSFHSLAPSYHAFGWNDIPKSLGVSPATANRRFREWTESGAWTRFWGELQKLRSVRSVPRPIESPVLPAIIELQRAYSFFNLRLFGNVLPSRVAITIEQMRSPRSGHGTFAALNCYCHVAIAFRCLRAGPMEVLHTLIHEMVHCRNHIVGVPDVHIRYHNRHFRDSAALAGLRCRWVTNYGYGVTELGPLARSAIRALKPNFSVFRWAILRKPPARVRSTS